MFIRASYLLVDGAFVLTLRLGGQIHIFDCKQKLQS